MHYKILFFILFFSSFTTTQAQIIDEETGIPIYYQVDENTFPASWKTAKIAAQGTSLDDTELERSISAIKRALRKYPTSILRKNIAKIYILKHIEFYGQPFGGTNSTDVVYLVNGGTTKGYTQNYIEKSFHHEFSSILLRNFSHLIDKNAWKKTNTLKYGKGGVQALKDKNDSQKFDNDLHKKGFLYAYAVSSLENDFNSFAENLFKPESGFYEAIDNYESVEKKFRLIIKFYASLDSSLNEQYFRSLQEE